MAVSTGFWRPSSAGFLRTSRFVRLSKPNCITARCGARTRSGPRPNSRNSWSRSGPFDDRCAAVYGRIRARLAQAGSLIGPNDLVIAAIAVVHGATLVTNNIREFNRVEGLALEDWEA